MTKVTVLEEKEIYRIKNYWIREDVLRLPSGSQSKHLTIVHPGAVVILPMTASGSIIFLRQYRHSMGKEIFELPAGTRSINEDPEICAARELIEETNFRCGKLESLGELYPAPGFCDEVQYLFIASELQPEIGIKDEDEIIETVELSVSQVLEMIREDQIKDGKTLACILRAILAGKIKY